ncbi:MAG TPA: O-antigen ligase family protein [Gemmataceae bacterium]|nr:O-antigen ligase family protein [Gemmataceae bacterium]
MKQLIFMIVVTLIGVGGSLAVTPFYGVAVYYFFAVLRPQFIWKWSLPEGVNWSLYVALAAMLGAILNVRSRKTRPTPEGGRRLSAGHWLVLGFGAWIAVTFVTARDHEVAYPYFIEYLKLFIMFWVAATVIRSVRQVWVLYLLTAATLGYIAYEVNYIYFFQGRYTYIYRLGYGGLDNNGAGLMLAMGIPLCYFAWEGIGRWFRWAFLVLIPLLLHAVLMSYSRGAMVSLLAGVPFYLLRSRRKFQLLLVLAGVVAIVPVLAGKEIRERFFSIQSNDVDASANARRSSWAAAWEITKANPVFGVGIRNSNLISYEYGADMEGRTIHSQYLQTSADSGLIALGLYLAALTAVWFSTRRARLLAAKRIDTEGREAHAAACGVEGAMIVFCVGASFLSLENFELPYLMLLLGAQLPLVLRPAPGPVESAETELAAHADPAFHARGWTGAELN